jgi:predicted aspartyl protease
MFAAVSAAGAAAPLAVIPYKVTSEGALTIDVLVNGRGPYPFIVDTGATLTIVFENLARRAELARVDRPALRVLSISGAKTFEPFKIGDLFAGALLAEDHVGVVLEDWDFPRETPAGIIGLDILEKFAVAFDVRNRTLSFYEHDGLPPELTSRMRKTPIRLRRFDITGAELYTTRGRINGEQIEFILDLGISTTLINFAAGDAILANSLIVSAGRTTTTGTRLEDVFDDRTRVNAGVFRTVSVGRRSWQHKVLWVYDAPLFDELGVQRLAYGLLGADLLASRDFAIDFKEERLYLGR